MHASSLDQLATALESEPWSVVTPIPPASQQAVDALLARGETSGGVGSLGTEPANGETQSPALHFDKFTFKVSLLLPSGNCR